MRPIARRLLTVGFVLLAGIALAGVAGWQTLRASLPQLAGERVLPGLGSPVEVERDHLGVPTVRGASRLDVARATGFLHAQDRFFQMDLMRRSAAGQLAELLGPAALPIDRARRIHRLRALAQSLLPRLPVEDRALLLAYTQGVNAGLQALGSRPAEYLLLRATPAPWVAEDTFLVVGSMFFGLQGISFADESLLGVMHDVLPPALFAFLQPSDDEREAPIAGTVASSATPIPGPEIIDLRREPASSAARRFSKGSATDDPDLDFLAAAGSNAWAVGGAHTATGAALLANDMHLEIGVPNVWYRMALMWRDPSGHGVHQVVGVTLPGTPAVVVGTNGNVAWGFTNAFIDASDRILLEPEGDDPETYRTPGGPARLQHYAERLRVNGAQDETLDVAWTRWGPVFDKDEKGRSRALAWVAHLPDAFNLDVLEMEAATSVTQALDIASRAGIPAQNIVVADREGHIGWTIAGAIPNRVGLDGTLPTSWADGSRRWDGVLPPAMHPRIVDPPSGRIWTANNHVVMGLAQDLYSSTGVDEPDRARQIRDDLLALDVATPRAMLDVQLDDRALSLDRWRDLLVRLLSADAVRARASRGEFRDIVQQRWTGRADADSAAYTLVRQFRLVVAGEVFGALTAACRAADPTFGWPRPRRITGRFERPLWRLVTERPPHLVPPQFRTWDEWLLSAVDRAADAVRADGLPLAAHPWGSVNNAIRHPLSAALGRPGTWLDMPLTPLAGGTDMPRIRVSNLAASERLVVSPGREEEGLFHMPGGQSGHPLSPHYRDGHAAWVSGEPTPLLPGSPVHRLVLKPAER